MPVLFEFMFPNKHFILYTQFLVVVVVIVDAVILSYTHNYKYTLSNFNGKS